MGAGAIRPRTTLALVTSASAAPVRGNVPRTAAPVVHNPSVGRTRLKFVPPTAELPDQWVAALGDALSARDDIVAAYWVSAIYLDAPAESQAQDELHLELRDPPVDHAPPGLFREISEVLPRSAGFPQGLSFTIPPVDVLPSVRQAGMRVY
jgi:hypothetical protein